MKLIFRYPNDTKNLELTLATKAYEAIWQEDGSAITKLFAKYTGLQFQQEEIAVIVHDGQSMSGKDNVPMRLNVHNDTLTKKRSALVHELAHRLLFGNRLYTPSETDPHDNDEIRVLLFQGDVLRDLYGEAAYAAWANLDPAEHTEDYLKDLGYVLSLSKEERTRKARYSTITTTATTDKLHKLIK